MNWLLASLFCELVLITTPPSRSNHSFSSTCDSAKFQCSRAGLHLPSAHWGGPLPAAVPVQQGVPELLLQVCVYVSVCVCMHVCVFVCLPFDQPRWWLWFGIYSEQFLHLASNINKFGLLNARVCVSKTELVCVLRNSQFLHFRNCIVQIRNCEMTNQFQNCASTLHILEIMQEPVFIVSTHGLSSVYIE